MVVVQAVIMYRLETSVMTPHIRRVFGRFHQRVARRMTVRQPRRRLDSLWLYPPMEDAMVDSGLQEVENYISLRQNRVA